MAPSVFGAARKNPTARCSCGHLREHHEHYRRGTDCALCDCRRFRRVWKYPIPGRRGPAPPDGANP